MAAKPDTQESLLRDLSARQSLNELIPDLGSWSWDPAADVLTASDRFHDLLGVPAGRTLGMDAALAAMPADDSARVRDVLRRMVRGELDSCSVEYRLQGANGVVRVFEGHCLVSHDAAGSGLRILGATKDVTDRREAEAEAALQAMLLDEIDAAVILFDLDRRILAWSDGAERLYGWGPEEAIGRVGDELLMPGDTTHEPVSRALFEEGRWEGEMMHARREGPAVPVYVRGRVILDEDGAPARLIGVMVDISERKAAQRELEAARDYLRAVTDTMDEAMYTLDVDGNVQYINPAAERLLGWSSGELLGQSMHDITHSHTASGAELAVEECPILAARAEGTVVEISDDVFVRRDGTHLPVSYTAIPFSADAGIEGCIVIFEDITERKAEERRIARDREKLAWAVRLREALAEDRLELYSQPIVDCADGRVVQQELLLRLHDPELGVVGPGDFLPIAEELGLIGEIDRWVIRRAAEIAGEHGAVEVNVSARSIADPHLVDHIEHAIARAGISPSELVFEITETAVIGDEQAARVFVERLHRLGCRVALDDFGTGYGTFTSLKHLAIDVLKIDVEFVRDLRHDPSNQTVVETVVSLAKAFGQTTVGEGVEDQETFELLAALGVDHAQGYHLGRPQPLPDRREPAALGAGPAGERRSAPSAGSAMPRA
jgi:PAS domain S-box-containing protein